MTSKRPYYLCLALTCVMALHLLPASLAAKPIVTLGCGNLDAPPYFTIEVKDADIDHVEFTLHHGNDIVETGKAEYPGGFDAFLDDVVGGFAEASSASIKDDLSTFGRDAMQNFCVDVMGGPNHIAFQLRSSALGYNVFVSHSIKLQRALTGISNGRPKAYRFRY